MIGATSFTASRGDGQQETVTITRAPSPDPADSQAPGSGVPDRIIRLATGTGLRVRRLQKGVYQLDDGTMLRSSDRDAP